jgi:uncharacterized protein (DUF2235 family)
MGKNIIIFSDGTGQKGGVGSNTNVYKLFNMVEDRTRKQIAYYDPGLGTNWQRITGNIMGHGFSQNLLDCYRFIFENFEADDQIYLFGFSRGAATVRSLSGFIHLFGVLPISRPDIIKEAYRIYKITDVVERKKKADEFILKHHTMWCKIRFVGVWDTVAALGLPNKSLGFFLDNFFKHRFHNFDLSDSVEFARHALSIDDQRKTFHPVLWNALKDDHQGRLKQVWFCGVHTDVGGGYPEEDLSNISLRWMIREAEEKGLLIYKKSPAYRKLQETKDDINGIMHNEQTGLMGKIYRRAERSWDPKEKGVLCLHCTVLERKKNHLNGEDPAYMPWVRKFEEKMIES